MIYTVTFNPALDYVVRFDTFCMGELNRTTSEELYFGGKGINVSVVLSNLGIPNIALGFIAGFTGNAIEQGLEKQQVRTDFIKLQNGFSRINVKIKSGTETEINGQGPDISEEDIAKLFKKLDQIADSDTLVLAGSIPKTLPDDIYERILEHLCNKQVRFVVDATGDLLVNVLKYKPFLIKPNHHELAEIFHVELKTDDDIVQYASKLQQMGAQNVLVSMASAGAILVDQTGKAHKIGVYEGDVVNSVGSGDSMVAGFLYGLEKTNDYEYALKAGTAAGCATAFSKGIATKQEILTLLSES